MQGTGSDVGKSAIVAGLCRVLRRQGFSVAPFKPQNMSNNAAACADGGEIGRAQALQAQAAGIEPTVDLNPVLLKPQSDYTSQVIVHGQIASKLDAKDYLKHRRSLLMPVLESFNRLRDTYDFVIVEGAGSPAETNLRKADVANMGFARETQTPVCLIGDIDRGGVIASVVGTKAVLEENDAAMIRSFIINKFRGNVSLFGEGVLDIETRTKWPCRGVIPWMPAARKMPQEDAVVLEQTHSRNRQNSNNLLKIVVPMLSRIANFDDFDPLRMEKNVNFQFITPGTALPRDSDVIILPGTKSTLGDLRFIREQGWDHDIIAHARSGGYVLGLCGGYQLLGKRISDPHGIEGQPEEAEGLGLLDVNTNLLKEKTVRTLTGTCVRTQVAIRGYEIHIGDTDGTDTNRRMIRSEHGEDGAINCEGNVEGCYVHGLFWSDSFRANWLNRLRKNTASELLYSQAVEDLIDEWADGLTQVLDINGLLADATTARI